MTGSSTSFSPLSYWDVDRLPSHSFLINLLNQGAVTTDNPCKFLGMFILQALGHPHVVVKFVKYNRMKTMTNISGCWLGTYWQGGQPTRFEATLIQGGSVLDGRILDDSYLGEACIQGELLGARIFFIKRYLTTSPSPIRYSGTLSEDGCYMQGNWRIGYFDSGTWEAYRADDVLMEELSHVLASKAAAIAQLPDVDIVTT